MNYFGLETRREAISIASVWLKHECVVLDTETTGLDGGAEICEVAMIDCNGKTLLDTLIKPLSPIPQEAIDIHGITNEMVKSAPSFVDIYDELISKMGDSPVVIYNADYDVRLINQTLERFNKSPLYDGNTRCAMRNYAEYFQMPNLKHGGFKWQSLVNAASQQGVELDGAHRALTDCKMTLEVLKAVARAEA